MPFSDFNDNLESIKIFSHRFAYLQADENWKMYDMVDPYNRLYLVNSGSGYVRYNGEVTMLLPGHVYMLPAYKKVDLICEGNMEKSYHHFNVFLPDGRDLFQDINECLVMEYPMNAIYELLICAETNTAESLFYYKKELYNIICNLIKVAQDKGYSFTIKKYPPEINTVFAYIATNLSAKLRVSDCAKLLCMSSSTFSTYFKKHVGTSTIDYIHEQMIRKSKEMLFTSKPIKEISDILRFGDQYYFSHFFSKHEGISPSQYRKKVTAMYFKSSQF